MKICYIASEYPPETGYGGIGTYTRTIAEYMSRHGHEVHVITRNTTSQSSPATQNGVRIHRIAPGAYPLPKARLWYPLRAWCYRFLPMLLMRMSWARAVARYFGTYLSHIRFDIIEYPECGAEGLFLRTKNKKVVRLHSPWGIIASMVEPSSPRTDRLLHRLVETISIYKSSAVSSPTRFLLHRLKLHSLVYTVIPNPIARYGQGMTQRDIKNSSSRNSLVFVGRMDPLKAPHLLITAYHQLHAHAPNDPPPPLIMVGGFYGHLADHTPYGEYITRLASRGEGSRGITFTGAVAHAQIPTYFQSARIAVFTSRWENMPYTCLEAMASGCVVVASDCAGLRELVDHGVTGFLFRKNSAPHLARALSYVLRLSPQMHQRISHAAFEKVRREFDAEVAGKKIEQWYTTLIE